MTLLEARLARYTWSISVSTRLLLPVAIAVAW